MHVNILDRAMQTFGAMGLSPDTPLPELWTMGRKLRIADGPDELHVRSIANRELTRDRGNIGAAAYLTPPFDQLESVDG